MNPPTHDQPPLTEALRDRTAAAHSGAESAGFMADLLGGRGSLEDYRALVSQHYFIYRSLEQAAERLSDDVVAGPFITDRLTRLPALEADLAHLIGPNWRSEIEPLPVTARYTARIDEVGATWPAGFVAHHYTRYLGDLSGGIFIGRVIQRKFGLEAGGATFYTFAQIDDPTAFKDAYRERLDATAWHDGEQERVIQEVLRAYAFNSELFAALAELRAAEPAA